MKKEQIKPKQSKEEPHEQITNPDFMPFEKAMAKIANWKAKDEQPQSKAHKGK